MKKKTEKKVNLYDVETSDPKPFKHYIGPFGKDEKQELDYPQAIEKE